MPRMVWMPANGLFYRRTAPLSAGGFSGDVRAGEDRRLTLHHQAAGLTVTLLTQPRPPRAGENLLRVDLTDVLGRPIPYALVRLVLTQATPMAGMHLEPSREVEATSTHMGVYVGRVHVATPGRWEVIVQVVPPGRPATAGALSPHHRAELERGVR